MIPLKDDIPTRRTPVITIALIAINVIVYFAFEQGLWGLGDIGNERVSEYGAVPFEITNPGDNAPGSPDVAPFWLTILTSMYLHGSLLHLGGNMLFLWIFGDNVEDRLGHAKFLIFYLLAGIAATLAQFAVAPHSAVPNVGASGAIAGVLGAYILMFPQSRVNVLLGRQVVAMPAIFVLGMWIVLQLISGVGTIAYTDESANSGGVAYMAHIGGFAAGLLMAFLLRGTSSPSSAA